MPKTIQEHLADATLKAASDLTAVFLRLPEDKRDWSPDEKARTALDQFAECAILCGYTAETITTKQLADGAMENFFTDKTELKTRDWEQVHALFQANVTQVTDAIRAVSEDDMGVEIAMPWGPMTLAQMITYPHWNLTYHEGQINYIASILGCLG